MQVHLDSDCVLLAPLSRYPLERHAVWLVNNDFYQEHGLSPLPSASIHAAVLDGRFCAAFERLYFEVFEAHAARLPAFVRLIASDCGRLHACTRRGSPPSCA